VAEPVVDRTVRIEGGHMGHRPLAAPEPFTRGEQHGGLVLAELGLAAGVGLLLAGAATFLSAHGPARRLWLALVAAAIWATVVLPAIKYPPLPPGVDSALPIGERQRAYLALIAAGLLGASGAAAAWRSRRLRSSATAVVLVPAALAIVLLPGPHVRRTVPASVLHDFRLVSVLSELLFWLAFALAGAWLLRPRQ
jgi:predicted cobalt transporter CbtA